MAELYVFGQIESASGFDDHSLFCKWTIHSGESFIPLFLFILILIYIFNHFNDQVQAGNSLKD